MACPPPPCSPRHLPEHTGSCSPAQALPSRPAPPRPGDPWLPPGSLGPRTVLSRGWASVSAGGGQKPRLPCFRDPRSERTRKRMNLSFSLACLRARKGLTPLCGPAQPPPQAGLTTNVLLSGRIELVTLTLQRPGPQHCNTRLRLFKWPIKMKGIFNICPKNPTSSLDFGPHAFDNGASPEGCLRG